MAEKVFLISVNVDKHVSQKDIRKNNTKNSYTYTHTHALSISSLT